ncbi:cell division protein FtsA [Microgenomates group bacterium RBG_16_45_19]|nr:MAG: cell division protein FtsA [Microgenomates group bacterium RBG_16_45_19]
MAKGRLLAGIDIGTDKICTVIASQAETSGLTNVIGVATAQSQGLRKSQIVDLEETISAITDSVEAAERMAGYNLSSAFVSVSGVHIESQNSQGVVAVSEPEGEITPQDIDRVIEAARAVALPSSREVIHVIPRDFTVDAQSGIKDPKGMTGVRLEAEAHIITGAVTALKNVYKCLDELGIALSGPVFSGLASATGVLSETEKELGVACLDIGAGTTSVTVYVEDALTYSAVIPVGARNLTNDLAIGMRLSLASAEKIKLFLSQTEADSQPPPNATAAQIAKFKKEFDTIDLKALGIKEETTVTSRRALVDGIIRPRLKEIFQLVGQHLKDAGLIDQIPAGLVIAGGGALTVASLDMTKRTLSLPARLGQPQGLTGLVDELGSPLYATAVGLILYAQEHGAFQPLSSPRSPSLKTKISHLPLKQSYQKLVGLVKSLLPG